MENRAQFRLVEELQLLHLAEVEERTHESITLLKALGPQLDGQAVVDLYTLEPQVMVQRVLVVQAARVEMRGLMEVMPTHRLAAAAAAQEVPVPMQHQLHQVRVP
jgi:hypothetical protein